MLHLLLGEPSTSVSMLAGLGKIQHAETENPSQKVQRTVDSCLHTVQWYNLILEAEVT